MYKLIGTGPTGKHFAVIFALAFHQHFNHFATQSTIKAKAVLVHRNVQTPETLFLTDIGTLSSIEAAGVPSRGE